MITSFGYTSYDTIDYKGWEITKDRLVLTSTTDNYLRWAGKTGEKVQIAFESPTPSGTFLLSWDGQEETWKFSKKKIAYEHAFDVPFYASTAGTLTLGILNFALLMFPLCLLVWMKRDELLPAIQLGFAPISQKIDTREWLVVAGVAFLALALRVPNLEILFPSVEEYSHINAAKQIIQGAPLGSVYERSLWLVTVPVTLMFRVFGYHLWAARLLGVIFNVLALLPLYLLARKINRPVAVLSILLFATSPWIIAISRVVREYAFYPFYFFWVVYGMIWFLEQIPDGFRLDRDWKVFFKSSMLWMELILAFLPFYALDLDYLSTFKLVLIAYPALGLFAFLKLDLRYRKNLILVLALLGIALRVVYPWRYYLLARAEVNWIPLKYFFINSPQQWYFERTALLPALGLLGLFVASFLVRRKNIIPLFFVMLYGGSLSYFLFSAKKFFAPRHLSTTQIWYVLLAAIGLYLLWLFLQSFPSLKGRYGKVATMLILACMFINPRQVLVPITSRDPAMPITEDYHNDLTDLQTFMLANVQQGDVLIASRIYSRYVEWVDAPVFQKVVDFQVQSTEADVLSVVDQYDSGWIIIDNARIERATFSPDSSFLGNDRIEYVGLFDDEHVWRWREK
ncbi:MAG: glycosyltransferase family 39 protein [Anaerolineales bacterium]